MSSKHQLIAAVWIVCSTAFAAHLRGQDSGFSEVALPVLGEVASPMLVPEAGVIVDEPTVSVGGLTLEEAQSLALQDNPNLGRARALVQAARGRAYQVGLKPNPNVGVDLQQLFSGGQAEQYGVTLEQTVVRKEKLQLNRSVAGHEVDRLQQQFASEQQRVLTDVHLAYVQTLRAQRQIDLTRELVEINKKALELSEKLFEADEVAKTDVLQAGLEVSSAEMLLREGYNRHIAAWRALEAICGQPSLAVRPLAGDLYSVGELLEFESALEALRTRSPEISVLVSNIEKARCQLRRQQVEPLPDVSVRGLLNWRDNGVDGDANAGLAVSIPLPVNDKNEGAIQEARYQLVAAQRELERLELALASRLTPVYLRYANGRQRVEAYQGEMIPKAEETMTLIRDTYELGEVSFASLLTAQRTYAQMRLAYIDALESYHLAKAEISGMLLTGSLQ